MPLDHLMSERQHKSDFEPTQTVPVSGVLLKLDEECTRLLVEIDEEWYEILRLVTDQHGPGESFGISVRQILNGRPVQGID